MGDILNLITKRHKITRIIVLIISLMLSALVFNLFLLPLKIVSGGSGGIATITNYLYDINPSIMIALISAACVIFSFMYLGVEKTQATILASILYPVFIQLTSPIAEMVTMSADKLLLIIFAGVLGGISSGLIYRVGYNAGGLAAISQILFEKLKISVAKSSLVINSSIVIVGAIFFGTTNALYAVIYLYICNIVTDKVLLGISNNKAFYIITSEEDKVKDYILKNLEHDVTIFDVKGGYKDQNRKVILTVVPSRDYYKVTEGIKEIDNKVFFVVTDSYQVEGGK